MYRHLTVLLAALILGAAMFASTAAAGPWHPGENYLVTEDDAGRFLEKAFDHAYCNGIPRFGARGSFPDQEFVMFDCSIDFRDQLCETRQKAIKGRLPGNFRMQLIRVKSCI